MKHTALLLGLGLGALLIGCDGGGRGETPAEVKTGGVFSERAAELGLDFHHFNGMYGEYFFCETVGSGAALFDYDNDGDLDVYAVQGAMLGSGVDVAKAIFPPKMDPLTDRLYRNDLTVAADGTRSMRFVDVTDAAGLNVTGYGMGVAAGDFDADGDVDLYVTNFGPNNFLRNEGNGTFTDITPETGTEDTRWSTSAAFVDYDRDGHLDLFVCCYVDFTYANHKECYSETSARDYCGPLSYPATPDKLFRNRGDGTFEDVTAQSNIASETGGALGVVCADLDGDKLVDLYVANDGLPNLCWINLGNGKFKNKALMSGTALNENGSAEASMGVDAADFDGDGDEDLFMTHLTDETNTLYLNDGKGFFADQTFEARLGVASRAYTGFGTAWFDYDNDGWLDLLIANGAVKTLMDLKRAGDVFPLDQINQLYRNLGDGTFDEVTSIAGSYFTVAEVSRGAAFGDVDNDGDTDVVVMNCSGSIRLLLNDVGNRHHWLGLRLVDKGVDRDVLGTRVEILRDDKPPIWRRVRAAASYCSANDPRVLVGLADDTAVTGIRVHWPNGVIESFPALEVDRYHNLRRGGGQNSRKP